MKTLRFFFCATLLATTAGLASAGPGGSVNLGWQECQAGGGALTRTFACNTNTGGGHILFGTFVAGDSLTLVTGYASVIDVQTAGATLAPWWDIRAGGCRATSSLVWNSDFTGGPFSCLDYFQGGAGGGNTIITPVGNRVRWKPQAALPLLDSRITAIPQGTEVYTFKLTLNNLKTVGLGACAGCDAEVCIVHNSMLVTQTPGTPGGNRFYSAPGTSAHAIWQSWTNPDPNQSCPAVTPAKNRTWGSIKAIYR